MGILQRAAKVMAAERLPLTWETPSGFLVQQVNFVYKDRRVKLTLGSDVIYSTSTGRARANKPVDDSWPNVCRVTLKEPTDIIDPRRQASSVAPNFIHSLDAAALALTVHKLTKQGLNSFALIHDSFGVHASDADTLAKVLRDEFVAMYRQGDLVDKLFNGFGEMLTAIKAPEESIEQLTEGATR
jgi:DNA-directed RNA polymerase